MSLHRWTTASWALLALALAWALRARGEGVVSWASHAPSALSDLDLTASTDFEDLAAVGGDMMEFVEQDRLLLCDGGLEAGLGLGAPALAHALRTGR